MILRLKIQDGKFYPPSKYPDPALAATAEEHLVDSFKHFLPFSDSIFIVSETPDKFAQQLSHFLIECFLLIGHAFDRPADPTQPETVEITELPGMTRLKEKWYPPLWRGGLASGEVRVGGVTAVEDSKDLRVPNLAGPAVVDAVLLEKKCRGPRLLCGAGFENNFGTDIQRYFRKESDAVSELLWPAFLYNRNNDPQNEMYNFQKLWTPAVALWKSKRGHVAFEHYDEFLKLLVRSFLCWAVIAGCEQEAREKVHAWISKDLSEQLISAYLL
ncbi:MAG: hypothetical protein WCS94_07045 [Verrucomicrobiota bacterium]